MDQQAASLLTTLKRPAAPSETKLNAFNALKSDIKHYRVPENAQATIFECVKLGITQQASSSLAGAAFSTLGHLLKRLKIQDPSGTAITHLSPRLYGAIIERLGDLREPIRTSASTTLGEMWTFLSQDVEKIIREDAICGSNARAKEAGIQWVVRMHQEDNMPFKSYVASIITCVEHADGGVREAAKSGLVDLFRDAPERAKADLKRQLKAHSVRNSIETQILSQIGSTSAPKQQQTAPEQEAEMTSSTRSQPALDHVAHFAESINSEAARPPPSQETVQMDPIYVHTEREVADTMRDMQPHFEGKETEQNWMPRDKSVLKLRRLLRGNAPSDHPSAFMAGIKSVMEGILKVANSLRTTMSSNGCQMVQELAKTVGPAIDPHVEILLQSFIKMSSATKHIAAENGRVTVIAIFQSCSYNVRLMQHIWSAAQEKNGSIRQCTPEWLRTILKRQASHKSHFESSGGLDLAEKCIRKGLDDANPKVKEAMRATYWTFAKTWPEKADAIINKLDPKSRSMLEKDSNNPNASLFGSQSSTGPTAKPSVQSGRSTLKQLMAEQRRAKSAARNLPERPNSAMALLSPTKAKPEANGANRAASKLGTESRVGSATSTASSASANTNSKGSSLMSGHVRRPRRPEIQRPQTADPYASRRLLRPETPANDSPIESPTKGTGASKASVPASSSRSRPRTAGGAISTEASPVTRTGSAANSQTTLAPGSRPASKDSTKGWQMDDFSSLRDDELTLVLPTLSKNGPNGSRQHTLAGSRPTIDKTMSVDSGMPAVANDQVPATHSRSGSGNLSQRSQSPETHRSPLKAMFEAARERLDRPTSSSSKATIEHAEPENPFLENGIRAPPIRRGSPVKAAAPVSQPEVQIYEDPTADATTEQPSNDERQVLSELPVNENVRAHSPTQSIGSSTSPAGSPHVQDSRRQPTTNTAAPAQEDRAEVLRNRRLLTSGIERVRARALDAHGFRRVQDLAKSTTDIWEGGKKYDELMSVLLDFLVAFESDAKLTQLPASKKAGLKAQALGVVRALVTVHTKSARAWFDRVLSTVLICRKQIDSGNSHIIADLERTMDETLRVAPTEICVDAVTQYLSSTAPVTSDESGSGNNRAVAADIAMALTYLRAIIKSAQANNVKLGQERRGVLARTSSRFLEDNDSEVRKADVELACEVFGLFDENQQDDKAEFWKAFQGVEEGRLDLLTYYLARNATNAQ